MEPESDVFFACRSNGHRNQLKKKRHRFTLPSLLHGLAGNLEILRTQLSDVTFTFAFRLVRLDHKCLLNPYF